MVLAVTLFKNMPLLHNPTYWNPDLQQSLWKSTDGSSGRAAVWCNKCPHPPTHTATSKHQHMCCNITSEGDYKFA